MCNNLYIIIYNICNRSIDRADEIKEMPFFANINWDDAMEKKVSILVNTLCILTFSFFFS